MTTKQKNITYQQITNIVEEKIKEQMLLSKSSKDNFSKELYHNWAVGAYLAWHSLTLKLDCKNAEDDKRLEDLTSAKEGV